MIKFLFKLIALTSVSLLMSSCATIFSGTTQTVNIQIIDEKTNKPLEGANCTVTDGKGLTSNVYGNPGTVLVHKGNGALTPRCIKTGYVQTNFGVGDSFNALTIVNVFFWPGFIVDAMTGAMKEYPSHIAVYMQPK